MIIKRTLLVALVAASSPAQAGIISDAMVMRSAPAALSVSWKDAGPVDVYVSSKPDGAISDAKLVSPGDADGRFDYVEASNTRSYFILRDHANGTSVRVAERLLPLERGSNFRDIGGYAAAGGKHVRWGMIYRSGATPVLSDADLQRIKALGLANMLDLRSDEERVLAPSKIYGVPYSAVAYSMASINVNLSGVSGPQTMGSVYRNFPTLLAPQLRILFAKLVNSEQPIVYNCSAGQDRTGFATAMILTALGVPRETIFKDYNLSTGYRHPENEMPKIDVVAQANNPIALFFARNMQDPKNLTPKPLYGADGTPFLKFAFDEVEAKWGSVDAYLEKEVGLTPAKRARLRSLYLQ